MTKRHQKYLSTDDIFLQPIYSCIHCRAHLASQRDLISKSFQGSQGRAYLFGSVVNVGSLVAEERLLLTGLHYVADIYCNCCSCILGWKYEKAFEPNQRYKEGKFIVEVANLIKDNCWDQEYRPIFDENGQINHSEPYSSNYKRRSDCLVPSEVFSAINWDISCDSLISKDDYQLSAPTTSSSNQHNQGISSTKTAGDTSSSSGTSSAKTSSFLRELTRDLQNIVFGAKSNNNNNNNSMAQVPIDASYNLSIQPDEISNSTLSTSIDRSQYQQTPVAVPGVSSRSSAVTDSMAQLDNQDQIMYIRTNSDEYNSWTDPLASSFTSCIITTGMPNLTTSDSNSTSSPLNNSANSTGPLLACLTSNQQNPLTPPDIPTSSVDSYCLSTKTIGNNNIGTNQLMCTTATNNTNKPLSAPTTTSSSSSSSKKSLNSSSSSSSSSTRHHYRPHKHRPRHSLNVVNPHIDPTNN